MSEKKTHNVGDIEWFDLSIENAEETKNFYSSVVGWKTEEVSMGEYSDYCMLNDKDDYVAGVCHSRGVNIDLPPQWLIYINVANLDESLEKCKALGGKTLTKIKQMGQQGKYCVIQDPSGAASILFEHT